jgi:cytochrome c-type biogenesis protein CcmH/NrfG
LADAALNSALRLQPDLPEVHLAYAYHLYGVYRDYERARVQLALARRGLPNDSTAIALAAYMDRRQGNFEKAIHEFNDAISRDPHNAEPIAELGNTLFWTRQFSAAEQAYDRLIELLPNQPMLKVQKAAIVRAKSGDATSLRLALEGLPTTMANDTGALCWRLRFALDGRDWKRAKELIEKMKGDEDDGNFVNGNLPVPVGCYSILLARLQREQVGAKTSFAQTREQLNHKVQKSPGDANLLSQLAVVDALLNTKEAAIFAAKRAVEILPVSRDAKDGPGLLTNLAIVYAWSSELDNAFKTIDPLTKMPNGISYGDLKLSVWWDPLPKDPRFGKLLTELELRD